MERVPYHHPFDKRYSLAYVQTSQNDAEEQAADFEKNGKQTIVQPIELDEELWLIYTATEGLGAAEDEDYDIREVVSNFDSPNDVIGARLFRLFSVVLDDNVEQEGVRVEAYKRSNPPYIEQALNQINWAGTATEVAGRLGSNLILKHALPNANHRTGIGMIEAYLRQIDEDFAMPDTSTHDYAWREWVNDYIERSKQLLTVRRNTGLFSYLSDNGCSVVERKDGIDIILREYDLTIGQREAYNIYAKHHETLWINFAETAAVRGDAASLLTEQGLSKHEFANEIREG